MVTLPVATTHTAHTLWSLTPCTRAARFKQKQLALHLSVPSPTSSRRTATCLAGHGQTQKQAWTKHPVWIKRTQRWAMCCDPPPMLRPSQPQSSWEVALSLRASRRPPGRAPCCSSLRCLVAFHQIHSLDCHVLFARINGLDRAPWPARMKKAVRLGYIDGKPYMSNKYD